MRYHYKDDFYVPDVARWQYIKDHSRQGRKAVGDMLNRALGALEEDERPRADRRASSTSTSPGRSARPP